MWCLRVVKVVGRWPRGIGMVFFPAPRDRVGGGQRLTHGNFGGIESKRSSEAKACAAVEESVEEM